MPRAQALARHAAVKAAAISGSLALPPGPLGLVTVLPDLVTIWKVQQLVADIAAVHGKPAALRQELMVYCLFKHGAAHLARELVVRVVLEMSERIAGLAEPAGVLDVGGA